MSSKTIRASHAVYDKINQELKEGEIVDDVLRRVFHLEAKARKRRWVGRRVLFLHIRNNYVIASLGGLSSKGHPRGGVRYKLPATTDDTEANAIVRNKVVAHARRKGVSEAEIDGIARFFRKRGYFLRRRAARQGGLVRV